MIPLGAFSIPIFGSTLSSQLKIAKSRKYQKASSGVIEIVVSVQVINEVSINLIRKANFDETNIRRLIESFYATQQVIETDKEVLLTASELRTRYRFSFWDSLIVASARVGECSILYSEDMDSGLSVTNDLLIVNPFSFA